MYTARKDDQLDCEAQARRAVAGMQRRQTDLYKDHQSLEFRFRVKRFSHIQRLIEDALAEKDRVEILDMGGTEKYWLIGDEFIQRHRDRLHITLVNPHRKEAEDPDLFTCLVGDATDPDLFAGRTFDIVHSNSVIEHVGDRGAMSRFAANTRRLGKRYFMQTPDYWFPYEPHFRFPFFQNLPTKSRVWLMMHMRLGFFKRQESENEARFHVESVRLLSKPDVEKLFPDANILHERVLGLSKSLMAVRG